MGLFYYYQDADNNNRPHNSWYADGSDFISSLLPVFSRGGALHSGLRSGLFAYDLNSGTANSSIGFRLVLVK